MAQLAVQRVSATGLTPAYTAADVAGDKFPNNGRQFLIVKNGGAVDVTVTVNSQKPCNYGFDHDLEVVVPAAGEKWIGPFDAARFDDPEGNVSVGYSAVADVTVAVITV